ncbi:MAG: beta-galactosidase [Planctomycetota bacterium]|nr:beta-galactosidase [Planctomycetota bacterium]
MKSVTPFLALLCAFAASARAAEALDPIRSVEIGKQRELLVNGKPFFPIMSWAQATSRLEKLRGLGFNTFNGSGKTAAEALEKAKAAGGYAMLHWDRFESSAKGHPSLLAYSLKDEPDMGVQKDKPRNSVEEVKGWYESVRRNDPSRPVFLNFTASFQSSQGADKPGVLDYYKAAAAHAEILCFDNYPVYQANRDDRLIWVAEGVSELRALGGSHKPVWAWIETSKGSKWITYERQKDVTPEITRTEVWMAVIRGATGIGYFTHAWRPAFTEFAPDEAMQAELKRTNEQLTRLAPAILSAPSARKCSVAFKDGLPGEVLLREHDGHVYLFANNLDMKDLGKREDAVKAAYRGGTATLSVEGLKTGTEIEVLDEGRTLKAGDGVFVDAFPPLGIHLYRFKP